MCLSPRGYGSGSAPQTALLERAIAEKKILPIDPRTLFFLVTHGGASIFSLIPLADRIGGAPPLDPAFIERQAKEVAGILMRGIAV
jgi:hypothetical protein